ncbi:MAG TPA: cation diffusion facilitator family transporter [Ignavibacteriales bacterium]|nr:cation diffusion facilitator family transporter [Ignavibacteriales bacterium]HOL81585.1 cation diffusion facilitator family transporter [Ignavibacteriales bacterium]HOM65585.1 cation diffusion facilitator family transporter [Ignavibacteriales bacterium]HPP33699.1 cation diffusion facilitator family transporter [Ignavibacteriales bacterium]HRR18934.1 cation diffusion facilitator family transporter [Ignavibacteriales bacterium]
MAQELKKSTYIALLLNFFLFTIKLIFGIISNSIALISEAVNSFTDIISSIAIILGVRISTIEPDEHHHFGHHAAQPLSTFIVAVIAGVLGLNIIQESIKRIITTPTDVNIDIFVISVLLITIITKLVMNFYQIHISKKFNSSAVRAQSIDSINDVLASSVALVGILLTKAGFGIFDPITGILVAFFIIKSGYDIARENIDYLMGKAADPETIKILVKQALKVEGVKGINDVRSYYVGSKYHIEIHIEVDKNTTTQISHQIGKDVQNKLESNDNVGKAFIHIDPV